MILYHPTLENVNVDSPEELVDRYKAAGWLEKRPDYSGSSAETATPAEEKPAAKKAAKKTAKKSTSRKK